MNDISMFDIIGPNMIGPSSSHTAGALRIAHLAGKLFASEIPQKITFLEALPKNESGKVRKRDLI